jgi:hypothetical protein
MLDFCIDYGLLAPYITGQNERLLFYLFYMLYTQGNIAVHLIYLILNPYWQDIYIYIYIYIYILLQALICDDTDLTWNSRSQDTKGICLSSASQRCIRYDAI